MYHVILLFISLFIYCESDKITVRDEFWLRLLVRLDLRNGYLKLYGCKRKQTEETESICHAMLRVIYTCTMCTWIINK